MNQGTTRMLRRRVRLPTLQTFESEGLWSSTRRVITSVLRATNGTWRALEEMNQ